MANALRAAAKVREAAYTTLPRTLPREGKMQVAAKPKATKPRKRK